MADLILSVLIWSARLFGLYFAAMSIFGLGKIKPIPQSSPQTRFAVFIPARNEGRVIAQCVRSVLLCNYPKELFTVFVIPNNCTDDTEKQAMGAGAEIIRCGRPVSNKGQALRCGQEYIKGMGFDAVCVFDADNTADPMFLSRMNDAFCHGAKVAKGRCTASNPHDSWVSGCYAIYFGLFDLFFNRARSFLGLSARLNGTGFAISLDALEKTGGFATLSTAEDAELSGLCALNGIKVHWVPLALCSAEHPVTFSQSLTQRSRWCGGIMQVALIMLPRFFQKKRADFLTVDFAFFSLTPFVQGLSVLTVVHSIASCAMLPYSKACSEFAIMALSVFLSYIVFTAVAAFITKACGMNLSSMTAAIICYPMFMASWTPISFFCIFTKKNRWRVITHGLAGGKQKDPSIL